LRSFSRVWFGEFRREPVDMTALARSVFEELSGVEPPPAVDFRVAQLPACRADPRLVKILLSNVIGNALKYTRNQLDRRIDVGVAAGSGPVTYYVRDNGAGFDPARADELFEPFRRPGAAAGDCPGLGLALACGAVHRHGGRIWASSRPGRGATFYFRLGGCLGDRARNDN
jgi:signal transduction histidine kinase